MKILNLSSKQFAGIKINNLEFTDGINLIFGSNESGKSSIANLILKLFFVRPYVYANDSFRNFYFPSRTLNNPAGDFAEGYIKFSTEMGIYKLNKRWSNKLNSFSSLETPDGNIILNYDNIDLELKKILKWGEAVYRDILFSSQSMSREALKILLSGNLEDISDAVFRSFNFMGSSGSTLPKIESAINEKIKNLKGRYWDSENNSPKNNRNYFQGIGEVHRAYNKLKQVEAKLKNIKILEEAAFKSENYFRIIDNTYNNLLQKINDIEKYSGSLDKLRLREEKNKNLTRYINILSEWQKLEKNLSQAKNLNLEYMQSLNLKINNLREKLKNLPSENEIIKACEFNIKMLSMQNNSENINLIAHIDEINNIYDLNIKSLKTGNALKIRDNKININEPVIIEIPEILKIRLVSSNFNFDDLNYKIYKSELEKILNKYDVKNINGLENLRNEIQNINQEINILSAEINQDELNELNTISGHEVRNLKEIQSDIKNLISDKNIKTYIMQHEFKLNNYINEFNTIGNLKNIIGNVQAEIKDIEQNTNFEQIPNEYKNYFEVQRIKSSVKKLRHDRDKALAQKSADLKILAEAVENIESDPNEELAKATRKFNKLQLDLKRWEHIQEVFKQVSTGILNNPVKNLSEEFNKNLNYISGGVTESEITGDNKLLVNIFSRMHEMNFERLSEGAKDSILLSFRLAILKQLFPNGGGTVVFDDLLTEMDDTRNLRSCELIKKFSENNQVIFLTCREEYLKIFGGNVIRI